MWNPRVCLVTNRSEWAGACLPAFQQAGRAFEIVGWDEASDIEPPVAAIAAHLPPPQRTVRLRTLRVWAERALQPCTVVLLAPVLGSALVTDELGGLGYSWFRRLPVGKCPPEELLTVVDSVVARGLWVAGAFSRELGNVAVPVVRVFGRVMAGERPAASVEAWAHRCSRDAELVRETGIRERHGLAAFMRATGLPTPSRMLAPMRLCWTATRLSRDGGPLDDARAHELGHASARALRRQAKRLSGRSLGELTNLPPEDLARLLVEHIPR